MTTFLFRVLLSAPNSLILCRAESELKKSMRPTARRPFLLRECFSAENDVKKIPAIEIANRHRPSSMATPCGGRRRGRAIHRARVEKRPTRKAGGEPAGCVRCMNGDQLQICYGIFFQPLEVVLLHQYEMGAGAAQICRQVVGRSNVLDAPDAGIEVEKTLRWFGQVGRDTVSRFGDGAERLRQRAGFHAVHRREDQGLILRSTVHKKNPKP